MWKAFQITYTGGSYLATTSTTTVSSTTTQTQQTSFQCYDCSGSNEQQCTTTTSNCPMCTIYRSDNDPSM